MIFEDVGRAANDEIKRLSEQSRIKKLDDQVRKLSWSEIHTESIAGVGGFSTVYKVRTTIDPLESRRFALKCLNSNTKKKQKSFLIGAVDLAAEGEMLSRLCHENIIQLHGVAAGGPGKAYMESERGYFLLLDLLEDTLQNKLDKSRNQRGGLRSKRTRWNVSTLAAERIQTVALGVAKGLEYLHEHGVVLRDLKPDNVGFDRDGTPKLFDLGFAREIHTVEANEMAGSLRYMAPEVALGEGSMLASDVYSFGVLLWELCTLEKPYTAFDSKPTFIEAVIEGGFRPPLSSILSPSLRKLIRACWDPNPVVRPNISQVIKILQVECSLGASLASRSYHQTLPNGEGITTLSQMDGMGRVNASFGFASRAASMGKIHSWAAAKKLSSSSLRMLKSLSRSSLGRSGSGTCTETTDGQRPKGNATFQLPAPTIQNKEHANMFLEAKDLVELAGGSPNTSRANVLLAGFEAKPRAAHSSNMKPKRKVFLSPSGNSNFAVGHKNSSGPSSPRKSKNFLLGVPTWAGNRSCSPTSIVGSEAPTMLVDLNKEFTKVKPTLTLSHESCPDFCFDIQDKL